MWLDFLSLPSWILVIQLGILETLLLINIVRFRTWTQKNVGAIVETLDPTKIQKLADLVDVFGKFENLTEDFKRVASFIGNFDSPEFRQGLWKEMTHGVMRGLAERAGSENSAEKRGAMTELVQQASESGDLGQLIQLGLGGMKGSVSIAGFKLPKTLVAQFIMQRFGPGMLNMQQGQAQLPSSAGGGAVPRV
jgi:hypothetical protein